MVHLSGQIKCPWARHHTYMLQFSCTHTHNSGRIISAINSTDVMKHFTVKHLFSQLLSKAVNVGWEGSSLFDHLTSQTLAHTSHDSRQHISVTCPDRPMECMILQNPPLIISLFIMNRASRGWVTGGVPGKRNPLNLTEGSETPHTHKETEETQ